jgi:hypothetical protein
MRRCRRPHGDRSPTNASDRRWHDLYHLDLVTGVLERRAVNRGFDEWLVDRDLRRRRR